MLRPQEPTQAMSVGLGGDRSAGLLGIWDRLDPGRVQLEAGLIPCARVHIEIDPALTGGGAIVASANLAARAATQALEVSIPFLGPAQADYVGVRFVLVRDMTLPRDVGKVSWQAKGASESVVFAASDERGLAASVSAFAATWDLPTLRDLLLAAADRIARLLELPVVEVVLSTVQYTGQELTRVVWDLTLAPPFDWERRLSGELGSLDLPWNARVQHGDRAVDLAAGPMSLPIQEPLLLPNATLPALSLGTLLHAGGLYADAAGGLIADWLVAEIRMEPDLPIAAAAGVIDLAARLGLEGLTTPLPFVGLGTEGPVGDRTVLIGREDWVRSILPGDWQPAGDDRGTLAIVPLPSGGHALVVTGRTGEAVGNACAYFGRHYPLLGAADSADLERELVRFLHGHTIAGQVARGWSLTNRGDPGRSTHLVLFGPDEQVDAAERELALIAPNIAVEAALADKPIFSMTFSAQWEGARAQARLRDLLQSRHLPSSAVTIDLTLSEAPTVRVGLEDALRAELVLAGADPTRTVVRVRSAYKPGMLWLLEDVAPAIKALDAERLEILVRPFEGKVRPAVEHVSRWIAELYPADRLLANRLGWRAEAIEIRPAETGPGPIYQAIARDSTGRVVLDQSWSPPIAARPYLDLFPAWGSVHPWTGWLRVEVDGKVVADERIATDLEVAWDWYQAQALPALASHLKQRAGDRPWRDVQPLFQRLEVELTASEPNEPLGVAEEQLSGLEAFCECVYQTTLDLFTALRASPSFRPPWALGLVGIHDDLPLPEAEEWLATGRIVPRGVTAPADDTRLTVRLVDVRAPVPSVMFGPKRTSLDERPLRIAGSADTVVRLTRAVVRPDLNVQEVEVIVEHGPADVAAVLGAIADLREQGAWQRWLDIGAPHLTIRHDDKSISLTCEPPRQIPTVAPVWPDALYDRAVSISETIAAAAQLTSRAGVEVWRAGVSLQGRPIDAVELTAPRQGSHRSQARLVTLRPVLLVNSRHHANEASATNAALALLDALAPGGRLEGLGRQASVAVIPIENPDGVAAYEAECRLQPSWIHHAAKQNAYELEFRGEYDNPDTPFSEAASLNRVWQRWLPDFFLDNHGYPAHEYPLVFAGYSQPWHPDHWVSPGLLFLFLPFLEDPSAPGYRRLAVDIRAAVGRAVEADPAIREQNDAGKAAYRMFGNRWYPAKYPLNDEGGIVNFFWGVPPDPHGSWTSYSTSAMSRRPAVTTATWVMEMADATAHGPYFAACVRAHIAATSAALQVLVEQAVPPIRSTQLTGPGSSVIAIGRHRVPPEEVGP